MLYLAIPAHNEAATIGVLLWRLRTVLAEFPREYEAVVYDDASSDSTSDILESYARVMPLTVLRGDKPVGYAGAVNALVRHVARQTRYPRRDAMLLLQGDFTDPPALVPEFVKRFEGGADVVVGERANAAFKQAPLAMRRLQRATGWMLRLLVSAQGVRDLTGSYRLIRISVLRDLLRNVGEAPVCTGDSQSANADFLLHLIPLARRVETLAVEPSWNVRLRDTRLMAVRDGLALARWAWKARGRRAVASTAPDTANNDLPRTTRPSRTERDGSNVLPFEAVESPRSTHARGAAPARKPRPSRPAAATSSATSSAAPSATSSAPLANLPVDDAEPATPLSAAAAEPARRKRTRRPRKEVAGTDAVLELETTLPAVARPVEPPESPEFEDRPALSPALSEAAEEAEASFDAELTARSPKKRRRRRGSRNRSGSGAHSGEPAENGADEMTDGDSPSASAAFDADSSAAHSAEPSAGNFSNDSFSGDDSGSDSDDAEESATGEPRARRRGRRGRRGGSRRNRGNRGEDGQESVSADPDRPTAEPPASTEGD